MRIARPWQLELEYQQQMMALALFLPRPQRILQLGLGAAALTKFCYRHLPEAQHRGRTERRSHRRRTPMVRPAGGRRPPAGGAAEARDYLGALRAAGGPTGCRSTCMTPQRVVRCTTTSGSIASAGVPCDVPALPASTCSAGGSIRVFGRSRAAFDDRVLAGPKVDEGNRIVFAFPDRASTSPLATCTACAAAWNPPGACRSALAAS